jgi:3-dehydroquinate synthase
MDDQTTTDRPIRFTRAPPAGPIGRHGDGAHARAMTASMFRVNDAIALPNRPAPIIARAARSDAYAVHVVAGMEDLASSLAGMLDGASAAVITDETVESLYGSVLVRALRAAGTDPAVCALAPGEASKSLRSASRLWDWLAESEIGRRDVVVNFGGGVIADVGGWVASAYMRGLPYVNVPTTLLAQVDGALGGKVAVNHTSAKNLLGAFYQPQGVIANVSFLRSTDGRHLRAGLAEAIKKAVIASPDYWAFIDANAGRILRGDVEALTQLVRSAAAIKLELIGRDPYEDDLRRPLNFGHTIGHPLETVTGYGPLLHGEAVAFGMVVEARIAAARGLLDEEVLDALVLLLRRCGLPVDAASLPAQVDGAAVVRALAKVRQIRAGSLRYVLPVRLGETVIADDVEEDEVVAALLESGVPMASPALR